MERSMVFYDLYKDNTSMAWKEYEGRNKVTPLLEYTGLKDRNGKEIYEGDRVDSGGFKGVVTYEPQGAIWIIKSERYKDLASSAQFGDERGIFLLDVFVEGNIFETPDKLK